MKLLQFRNAALAALLISITAVPVEASAGGVLLYQEPPSTYIELVRYKALREAPVISTIALTSGGSRQIRNSGVVSRLDSPPTSLHNVSEATVNATLSNIQKLTTTYPQYQSHLGQLADSWRKALATIKANANKAPKPTAAAAPSEPTLASLEINGITYSRPVLTGSDGYTASFAHDTGVLQVPVESLNPSQLAALNQTSLSVKIVPKPPQKSIASSGGQDNPVSPQQEPARLDEGVNLVEPSPAESQYTVGADCVVIAKVIVRLAQAAGDNTLADFERTLASVRRNRVDLFGSPTLERVMALFSAVNQLPKTQAESIKPRGLPNLHHLVAGPEMTTALLTGNSDALETLLHRILSGLPTNPFISVEMIGQRAFNLSERDRQRCFALPVFKRIGDMNGWGMRQRMASQITTNVHTPKSLINALGGQPGLTAFLGTFALPIEVTDRDVVVRHLATSYPTLPQQHREVIASQIAAQSELFLSNIGDLRGFGFENAQDAEVAFAASSIPVSQALVKARKQVLKQLEVDHKPLAEE